MLQPGDLDAYDPQWRVSDALLAELEQLLIATRPRSVFEAGIGATSVLIQRYRAAAAYPVAYTALESEGPWEGIHRAHLRRLGLDDSGVHVCPVTNDFQHGPLDLPPRFDLVLIDGPAYSQLRGGPRVMAILRPRCTTHTVFVVDDSNYMREHELCDEFEAWLQGAMRYDVHDGVYTWRKSTVLLPPPPALKAEPVHVGADHPAQAAGPAPRSTGSDA